MPLPGVDRQVCLYYALGMAKATTNAPVRERVLATASDLFYRQGYRATGINQIIAESGVAKASFYDHYPSKIDLLLAYAKAVSAEQLKEIRGLVGQPETARERFFMYLEMLKPWFDESAFRGCPFQNLIAEVGCDESSVREVTLAFRDGERAIIQELTEALIQDEPALAGLDVKEVTATYQVLLEGAIALSVVYRETWPVDRARAVLEDILAGAASG